MSYSQAVNYFSINDGGGMGGDWNNSGYWSNNSGGAPCGCGPSTIGSSFTYIQTDMNMNVNIAEFGHLEIATGKSLTTLTKNLDIKGGSTFVLYGMLKVYDLTFFNGSIIEIKPGGVLIVLHNFYNNNNSDQVNIDGTVTVSGTYDNGNGGSVTGDGNITATNYTGVGTTFGYANDSIPAGSSVSTGSLPIELVSFTASQEKGKVVLKWTTNAEINNDYFSVERSINGISFEVIKKIKGQGNSNSLTNYIENDSNPLHGISYYRLRQTDFDGKNSVSEIVAVDISKLEALPLSFEIYPNPISQYEKPIIKISEFESQKEVLVVVRDLLGQELYSKVIMTDFSGNSITAIDIENRLPAGTYLIIGTSVNQIFNKYLVIK